MPNDKDPTAGTSWGPDGADRNAFMNQSLPGMQNTRMSWDGDTNATANTGGGGGGGGCLLISGILGGLGLASAIFGARYGIGA